MRSSSVPPPGAAVTPARRPTPLLVLAVGVLILHTAVTVLEEQLFRSARFKRDAGGAFMTLIMYTATVLVYAPGVLTARRRAQAELRQHGPSSHSPLLPLISVSVLYVGTTTLTKSSLRYIDMPTQTVLKSSKLLPVMAGSILVLGKRYSRKEWLAAVMLCAGVAVFNSATSFPSLQQTALGSGCIGVALLCDALLGNHQQKVLATGTSVNELMLVQSAFGAASMLVTCVAQGTLLRGLSLLAEERAVLATLCCWVFVITAGTALVLQLVAQHSAVVAIVVTTARKALTLFASFLLFPKPLGLGHLVGAGLVFGSVFVARKSKAASKAAGGATPAATGTGAGAAGGAKRGSTRDSCAV